MPAMSAWFLHNRFQRVQMPFYLIVSPFKYFTYIKTPQNFDLTSLKLGQKVGTVVFQNKTLNQVNCQMSHSTCCGQLSHRRRCSGLSFRLLGMLYFCIIQYSAGGPIPLEAWGLSKIVDH